MAKLTARARRKLPAKAFAYPPTKGRKKGAYPIHDAGHRTAALREASKSSTSGTYRGVKRAICKKYPSLGMCKKGKR